MADTDKGPGTDPGTGTGDPGTGTDPGTDEAAVKARRDEAKGLIKEAIKEFAEENQPTRDTRKGSGKTLGDYFHDLMGI